MPESDFHEGTNDSRINPKLSPSLMRSDNAIERGSTARFREKHNLTGFRLLERDHVVCGICNGSFTPAELRNNHLPLFHPEYLGKSTIESHLTWLSLYFFEHII